MNDKTYVPYKQIQPANLQFALGQDRGGKTVIHLVGQVACVTPAAITNWPRCTGQGNFGTMFGPADPQKAKYTLDLTDAKINGMDNTAMTEFMKMTDEIDDRLLDFVFNNQQRVLGRRNLSKEEVKMLQVRTRRTKIDKTTGITTGHCIQLSTGVYAWDGMGTKVPKILPIVDYQNKVIMNPVVNPGDVVAACCYVNQIYTQMGGDKFGIHLAFDSVQVVCQRSAVPPPVEVPFFNAMEYDFAAAYKNDVVAPDMSEQFPMVV